MDPIGELDVLQPGFNQENTSGNPVVAENTIASERILSGDAEPSELVVLDPEHPLMSRFQDALKKMLLKHIGNAEIQLREKDEELKRAKTKHVELGCELYNFQQELAKYQLQLEKKHCDYNEFHEKSEETKAKLQDLRNLYKDAVKNMSDETKRMHKMRDEVDTLCLRLFYLNNAKSEVSGDIMVLRRAAEKATIDLTKFEEEKLQQDLLVDRIQNKVDQLKEDIGLFEAQIAAQESEMETSQNLLHEAEAQIVAITVDKKHLLAQWKTSLLGLQRRNEAYAALLKAYNELKEELLVLENEKAAYQRAIGKEQEKHEKLTVLLNKNEADLNTLRKQLLQIQTKHEADKQTYSTYTRMLQETERNLSIAQNENNTLQLDVDNMRKQIEKETLKKQELNTKISDELRARLTAKKSADYVNKLSVTVKDQSRELLSQIAQLENQIARDELAVAKQNANNKLLEEQAEELEQEIAGKNLLITKLETEIHHANVLVERKQGAIDILNKKLERLVHEAGGQEVGPLEATINNLNKAISAKQDEIGELEQQWLKEQNELVHHVNEKDNLSKTVTRINKQLSILQQKKLRIDNEISMQEREKNELERELRHLQNDMSKLNMLIAKEKSTGENLVNENKLAETDFVRNLKEKELEIVELQNKVDNTNKEKEDLLNNLVEVERSIMLWEKKVQLCEETRKAVECNLGQGEMSVMRHEIHRMEVRKSSLLQQQEKLMQALERSVSKRDSIVVQTDILQSKHDKAQVRISAQRQIDDLKKKLKTLKQNSTTCQNELNEMEDKIKTMEESITLKKQTSESEQKKVDELSDKLQKLSDDKQINVFEIQMLQHATNYWDQLKEGRYRRLCPSATSAENERNRQTNRARTLLAVIDKLISEYPQIQRDLEPIRFLLNKELSTNNGETKSADLISSPVTSNNISDSESINKQVSND